ncbi:MAG: c-type cytochrome [Methylococcales bacterium]
MALSRWVSRKKLSLPTLIGVASWSETHADNHNDGKRTSFLVVSLIVLVASNFGVAAEETGLKLPALSVGNAVAGKQKSDDGRCQECHGVDGNSDDERIPHHAGQTQGYLIKQLKNFQTGERRHQTMVIMAEDLSEADKQDITAYFAGQKIMEGDGKGDTELARNLFLNGDSSRNIPACGSCHGERGKGRVADNVFYPVIGGQRRVYLRSQLVSWKLGERTNSPDGVMNKIAKVLTDDEITALANYLTGL